MLLQTQEPRATNAADCDPGLLLSQEHASFAPTALRLAGLAGALFGWTPDIFWAATPAELGAIVAAVAPPAADPPDTALIARLMEAFPDG